MLFFNFPYTIHTTHNPHQTTQLHTKPFNHISNHPLTYQVGMVGIGTPYIGVNKNRASIIGLLYHLCRVGITYNTHSQQQITSTTCIVFVRQPIYIIRLWAVCHTRRSYLLHVYKLLITQLHSFVSYLSYTSITFIMHISHSLYTLDINSIPITHS